MDEQPRVTEIYQIVRQMETLVERECEREGERGRKERRGEIE